MTATFYTLDGKSLYADTDGGTPRTSIWPVELIAKYHPDVASHLASDLAIATSEFQGLDEALQMIDPHVQSTAQEARTTVAERLRGVLA